jgi:hypothetical protein
MKRLRPYGFLFVGLSVLYHSNLRPIASGDTLPASLLPFSILLDHTLRLDRFGPWVDKHAQYSYAVVRIRGHYYSGYPITGPILITPFYVPLLAVPRLRNWTPDALIALARILEKFAAVALSAFSAMVMLLLLSRLTSGFWALRLTLVYALGTAVWSISSQALWQHTTGQLAIIGSLLFLDYWSERKNETALWLCGASAACALMIRPSNVVLLVALVATLLKVHAQLAEYVRLSILPVAGGLLIWAYNSYLFQNALGLYAGGFSASLLEGLSGILLSPARGLLIYTPVAIFALCAFLPHCVIARRKHCPLFVASTIFTVLYCLVIATWWNWWGGYSWGPRLLSEIVPPLVVLIALGSTVLQRHWAKRTLAVLTIYCCLIQALGAYFYPNGHWDRLPVSVDQAPGRLWNWRDNPIGRSAAAGPVWEPYVIVGATLSSGVGGGARKMHELEINGH